MKKALIFSFDAIISIIIMISMMSLINQYFEYKLENIVKINRAEMAEGILSIIERESALESMNNETVNSLLNNLTPSNYFSNLEVRYYDLMNNYVPSKSFFVGNQTIPDNYEISTKAFVNTTDKSIKYFGIAVLKVWT